MSAAKVNDVWMFVGSSLPERSSSMASAVFSTRELAEAWIARFSLSGLLTRYTLDVPAFEKSLELGTVPVRQQGGELRQVWAGGEVHFHYEGGERVG